jgi:hypothetical protein
MCDVTDSHSSPELEFLNFKEFKNRFRFKGINSASICTGTTTIAMERGDRFKESIPWN